MGIHFRIKFALQNCFTVLYRFTGIIYHKVKNTQYALHNLFWYAQWGYRNGGFLRACTRFWIGAIGEKGENFTAGRIYLLWIFLPGSCIRYKLYNSKPFQTRSGFYSMVIYFFSSTAGFGSCFGMDSFRMPCLNSPLISSCLISSPI